MLKKLIGIVAIMGVLLLLAKNPFAFSWVVGVVIVLFGAFKLAEK